MSKQIPLKRRDGSIAAFALVDDKDYDGLSSLSWYLGSRGYAMRQYREPTDPPGQKRNRAEMMHRRILGLPPGDKRQSDHINRNPLDNRRENLRIVTHAQNQQNKIGSRARSGVRGVHWQAGRDKWMARVRLDGKLYTRCYFDTIEEAAAAAAELRRRLHTHAP
jgi:hypothetical protein